MVDKTKEENKINIFKKLFNKFLDEVYPEKLTCANCQEEVLLENRFLCDKCNRGLIKIDYSCLKCGDKIFKPNNYCDYCKNKNWYFDKAISCFEYSGVAKSLIYKLKYNNKKFIAKILAKPLADKFLNSGFDKIDIVTCVPTTTKRLKQRGYNQAEALATEFCNIINKNEKVLNKNFSLVKRVKDVSTQINLTKEQRKQNLLNAFEFAGNKEFVKGKNILIIDDVFTTGATVEELSKVFKINKANKVYVLTVCHTCLQGKQINKQGKK